MATWPDLTDYHEALQNPPRSFTDPELQKASIEQDRFGMPKPATGGNAVVYQARSKKEVLAVRCFLRPISDHAERYAAISKHLEKARVAYAARFVYLRDGIRVRGAWFPIVKMQWVEGRLLDAEVERLLQKPKELPGLRERWRSLVRQLEKSRIAHGDLQHGNVLVRGDDLLLVDYDGMWVPTLAGRKATEVGHRAYQHPKRSEEHYGSYLDRFSALVVYVSLVALEADPGLWERYNTGDNLIFIREDYVDPARSPLFGELAGSSSRQLRQLAGVLAACARKEPSDVPALETILARPKKVKGLELTPVAAVPAAKRKWSPGQSQVGLIRDLAPRWQVVWSRPGERTELRWKREIHDVPTEVEKAGEALAPDWGRALLAAGAGLAAGVAVAHWVLPGLGLVAAGAGLAATRLFPPRRRAIRVKQMVTRRLEEQVKEEVRVAVPGHRSAVTALQCSPDGRRIRVLAKLGECGVWDLPEEGYRTSGVRLPPYDQAVLARSAARAALATERAALVFELDRAKKTEIPVDAAQKLRAVALTDDGARMALGYEKALVELIDIQSRRVLLEVAGQGARITALAFSGDGQALVAGTAAGAVVMARLSPRPEKLAEELVHRSPVTALAAAIDGELFASGDDNGLVTVWGKDGKRRATATLASRGVRSLAFAGEGPYLVAAGCGDGSVKVLDADTGAVIATQALGGAAVTALAYAPQAKALAAGTAAGQVALLAAEP